MEQSNRHWIETLKYSIEVFDKPYGSLVEGRGAGPCQ
jgi:hypothetical protein